MYLSIQHLSAIHEVARELSFTRAAANLHITQSALSHRIAEAERQLGIAVFDRTTRSVTVTDRGQAVLSIVAEALENMQVTMERLEWAASGESHPIRITAIPSLAAAALPAALAQFRRSRPETRVDLDVRQSSDVAEQVRQGNADFGFIAGHIDSSGCRATHIAEEQVVSIVPASDPFSGRNSLSWSELCTRRVILPPTSSSLAQVISNGLSGSESGLEDTMMGLDLATTAGLVAAGLGVSVVPVSALPMITFAQVTVLPFTTPVVRDITLVTRKNPSLTQEAHALLHRCRTAVIHAVLAP